MVVVIPAHDEVDLLPRCLTSLRAARALSPVPVWIVVVLDSCHDGTAGVVGPDVHRIVTDVRNVGSARAAGFRAHASSGSASTWYVNTDADSVVARDHFRSIIACARDAHVVPGPVRVARWSGRSPDLARRYQLGYAAEQRAGVRHVHGANLAVRADAYWAVGGFHALAEHEDGDLVDRLDRRGYRISDAGAPSVITSARSSTRTPGGFASFLDAMTDPDDSSVAIV